jgi:hypothetical protein
MDPAGSREDRLDGLMRMGQTANINGKKEVGV